MVLHIGVDVGGTKVLAGEVDASGRVLRTAARRTPGRRVRVEDVEDALTEAVHEVADGRTPDGVGLAAAGFVDAERERVMFAPHLPWAGDPVRSRLAERWGVPVSLDNDANCAAIAEDRVGVAAGASSAVMVTMGTGIGGALVVAGRVWRGRQGMAGEFGHQQVVPGGRPCECGQSGCWEQYASGNALERFVRRRLTTDPTASTTLLEAGAGDPAAITGPMVTQAAEAGDALALDAFASVGTWLGVGLAGLVASFDPEIVVIGGGVSAAGDLLLEPAREELARSLVGGGHRVVPAVVAARTGPAAGLVGAAMLVATDVDADRFAARADPRPTVGRRRRPGPAARPTS